MHAQKITALFTVIFLLLCVLFTAGCGKNPEKTSVLTELDRANSVANLKQIGLGMAMYSSANEDHMPPEIELVRKYTGGSSAVYIANFDRKSVRAAQGEIIRSANTSYVWIMPYGVKISRIKNPGLVPAAFEKPWIFPQKTDKIAVLFADGHVEIVEISGASEMNCLQITEVLVKNIDDANLQQKILFKAVKEDNLRK